MRLSSTFVWLLSVVATIPLAAQTTIRVPADKPTIQSAIDSAAPTGVTVLVSPGTYLENVNFKNKSIVLTSTGGAAVTTIDGQLHGPAVRIENIAGTASVLNGFTITRGNINGGVYVNNASPTISANIITDSESGISIWGSNGQIIGNTIAQNYASSGGGIYAFSSNLTIRNNVITNNTATNYGGGIFISGGTSQVVQNLIANNTAWTTGGVHLYSGTIVVTNNTVAGNTSTAQINPGYPETRASGLYVDRQASIQLRNNIFVGIPSQFALYCDPTPFSGMERTFTHNTYSSPSGHFFSGCGVVFGTLSDPLFIASDIGDYHLSGTSPAVDTGSNSAANVPTLDLEGFARVVDGNNDSVPTVDMGVFELVSGTASVSPPSLTFADQLVDTQSTFQTVTVTNTGNTVLHLAMQAALSDFVYVDHCKSLAGLPPGQSCTVDFAFKPTTTGSLGGNIPIRATVLGGSLYVNMLGTGTGPVAQLNPSSVAFGSQPLGSVSGPRTISLGNVGTAPLKIDYFEVFGDFTQNNDCPATLAASSFCNIIVRFTPTQLGTRDSFLRIWDNASPTRNHFTPLTGTGIGQALSLSPQSLTFSAQAYGTTSAPQAVTITNVSGASLSLDSSTIAGDFAQTNNCPGSLAAGASCIFSVTFSPTRRFARAGTLSISFAGNGSQVALPLSGTGQAQEAWVTQSLQFGVQQVGVSSASKVIDVMSGGELPLAITSISTTGDFVLDSNDCPPSLQQYFSCRLMVHFTPTQTAIQNGAVQLFFNGPGSPATVTLSGIGTQAAFQPASISDFVAVYGRSAAPQTAQFRNLGAVPIVIGNVSLTGFGASYFTQSNDCPAVLAAGSFCTFTIGFNPVASSNQAPMIAQVNVVSDEPGSPHVLSLSGTGTYPQLGLGSAYNFGNQLIGASSFDHPVPVVNLGIVPVVISNISITGPFSQTNDCPGTLGVGQRCSVFVTFAPNAAGVATGTLTVTSDAFGPPPTCAISGTGVSVYPVPAITRLSPEGAELGSNTLTVSIVGANIYPASIVRINGIERPSAFLGDSRSNALPLPVGEVVLTTQIDVDEMSSLNSLVVTLVNPAPGGGVSLPYQFSVYRFLDVDAQGLVYDPYQRRLLATTSSTFPGFPDSLVTVNPWSGSVQSALPIGPRPRKLALAPTARTAFIEFEDGTKVRQIDVPGRKAGYTISLGTEPDFGLRYVVDEMAVPPGVDSTVVISRRKDGLSGTGGLVLYNVGVKLPNGTAWNVRAQSLAFYDQPDYLFGYNNLDTMFNLYRIGIDANGVTTVTSTENVMGGFTRIKSDQVSLMSFYGHVVNPFGPNLQGIMGPMDSAPDDLLPLPGLARVITLHDGFDSVANKLRLRIFSKKDVYTLQGTIGIPFIADAADLARWGSDGIAFRAKVDGVTRIALLRTSQLAYANTHLSSFISYASPATLTTGASNTIIQLRGGSFAPGMRVLWDGEERGMTFMNDSWLDVYIPASDLAQAETHTLSVVPADTNDVLASTTVSVQGPNVGTTIPVGGDIFSDALPVGRRTALSQQNIENSTAVPMPVEEISVQGKDYSVEPDCPAVLGAGESCDVTLAFSPRAAGPRHGQLTVKLGNQANLFPLVATGFDMVLALERNKRPPRDPASASGSNSVEAFASLSVAGISISKVRLGCIGAPAGTTCDVAAMPDNTPSRSNLRVTLRKSGRLMPIGMHTVKVTATVGDYTQALPVQFNLTSSPAPVLQRSRRLKAR